MWFQNWFSSRWLGAATVLSLTLAASPGPAPGQPEQSGGSRMGASPVRAREAGQSSPATPAVSPWKTLAVIPWGDGTGKLNQAIQSRDTSLVFRGPTCMVPLAGGGFAILDTLGNAVEEFDGSGQAVRTLPFPVTGADGKPTQGCDLAAAGPGDYFVLSAGRNLILRIRAGKEAETIPIPGIKRTSILTAISRDASGTLYVLDSDDASLFRIDGSGKALPRLAHKDLQGMVLDSKGHVYDLRLSNRSDARHLDLVRWSLAAAGRERPSTGSEPGFEGLEGGSPPMESRVVARIVSPREVVRMDVFGVDDAGNIYVTMASGAIEKPSHSEVVRFDPEGKETGRIASVQDPIELKFTHGKVVSADGSVFALAVRQKGLVVLKLESF